MPEYFNFVVIAIILSSNPHIAQSSYSRSHTECDKSFLASQSIRFSSPNFPFNYTENLNCRYLFFIDEKVASSYLCFYFSKFQLKQTSGCSDDWLDFEGVGKFCGNGWRDGDKTSNVSIFQPFCVSLNGTNKYIVAFKSTDYSSNLGFYSTLEITREPKTSIGPICPLETSVPCLTVPQKCVSKEELCGENNLCEDASDLSQYHAGCLGQEKVKFKISSFEDILIQFIRTNWSHEQAIIVPPYDHTTLSQEGHVMRSVGEASTLKFDIGIYPSDSIKCLAFWYFIHGPVYSFRVRAKASSTSGPGNVIWNARDDTGYGWKLGEVQLSRNWGSTISLIFESTQETGASVSIDDISLIPGFCSGEDISCVFELNSCAWEFSIDGFKLLDTMLPFFHPHDLQLTRNNAAVATLRKRASMISSPVSLKSPMACLMFSYIVASKFPNKSSIFVSGKKYDGKIHELSTLTPETGYNWEIAAVDFKTSQFEGNVRIKIETEGFEGAIAIDNITFTSGLCPKVKSSPRSFFSSLIAKSTTPLFMKTSSKSKNNDCQFKCNFGTACIDQSLVCNGFKDCFDSSDEVDCPKTGGPLKYFENPLQPSFLVAITVAVTVLVVSTVAIMFFVVTRRLIRRRHGPPRYRQSVWDQVDSPSDLPKPPPYLLHPPQYSYQAPPYTSTEQINLKDFDSPPPAFSIRESPI